MPARFLLACLLACFVGCRKQPASSSSQTEPAAEHAASPTDPSAAVNQADPSSAVANEAQMAALLGELTQAVRKYSVEQRQVPKTLEELVASGYLTRLPPAPAGKKFAINKDLQVYLAKR